MATLISTNGNSCIEVGNVDDVRIAGVILEAGNKKSDTLLKWGEKGYKGSKTQPGVGSDIFARVGGPTYSASEEVSTQTMVEINSNHVIIDHTWLWRADHDKGGSVMYGRNFVENALVVNGEGVTIYGLFAEHTLGNLVEWNGD
jgi:hypothetical protein